MLSLLAERKLDGFVPGITDLIEGGYQLKDGTQALSAEEKIERGNTTGCAGSLSVPGTGLRITMRELWKLPRY